MHTTEEGLVMGEIERRNEEEQQEIEDSVLALTEAGWTQREIARELNISRKSIQPYRERALSRITIPDHDQAVRENIVQLQYVMDECKRRLSDKDMPITATNVPNLLHQYTRARAELNKVLEVGNRSKVDIGLDNTLHGWMMANLGVAEEAMQAGLHEDAQRRDASLNYPDDVSMDDLELDPADNVFKLPSEFVDGANGDSEKK